MGSATQCLSSGWRINSAKDDASGQAIANRFTSLINGLTQASRNANDGISVAQTAEGAINEINENLHAIRRLTVQVKSTATISEADKKPSKMKSASVWMRLTVLPHKRNLTVCEF
ncbi:hypothetical protein SODG_003174 [Sodalis praecaptivus]